MYKIISITDHSNNDKSASIRQSHPQLLGDFYYLDMLRSGVTNGVNRHVISYGQMIQIKC